MWSHGNLRFTLAVLVGCDSDKAFCIRILILEDLDVLRMLALVVADVYRYRAFATLVYEGDTGSCAGYLVVEDADRG